MHTHAECGMLKLPGPMSTANDTGAECRWRKFGSQRKTMFFLEPDDRLRELGLRVLRAALLELQLLLRLGHAQVAQLLELEPPVLRFGLAALRRRHGTLGFASGAGHVLNGEMRQL